MLASSKLRGPSRSAASAACLYSARYRLIARREVRSCSAASGKALTWCLYAGGLSRCPASPAPPGEREPVPAGNGPITRAAIPLLDCGLNRKVLSQEERRGVSSFLFQLLASSQAFPSCQAARVLRCPGWLPGGPTLNKGCPMQPLCKPWL